MKLSGLGIFVYKTMVAMVPTLHRADTTVPAHPHVITVIIIIHTQLAAAIIILKTVISLWKAISHFLATDFT